MKNTVFDDTIAQVIRIGLLCALAIPSGMAHAQAVTLMSIITGFTAAIAPLAAVLTGVAVMVFVWGMVIFTANSGADAKRAEGKQKMIWGVVALFMIISVWGIVSLLGIMFGVDAGKTACKAPVILRDGTISGCE